VEKPFDEVSMALTKHLVVLVPSTEVSKRVKSSGRVAETQAFLTRTFGGTTTVKSVGTYTARDGRVIKEPISEVETYTTPKMWAEKKPVLLRWLASKKREWKQEELSIKFEEDMYWV